MWLIYLIFVGTLKSFHSALLAEPKYAPSESFEFLKYVAYNPQPRSSSSSTSSEANTFKGSA
jgi:hypothetical protein